MPARAIEFPFAWLTLAIPSARAQILQAQAVGRDAVGFPTRHAGRWPPLMLTRPTPLNCEIFERSGFRPVLPLAAWAAFRMSEPQR